ncbi:SDR family oxidoreductase [Pseudochryseolinea flava]|uniref:dTDP-4-dehydrorhamnose reductase n=1 Tax=Pseudochryseolinea flava TaxID=2059302 RepID=A0A364XVW2_9BACT|nr:NAD(P)-dependent oxidoreductase [Pseudochryseolinea flava]RAV98448.1 NAD(P)-dependent oxidoreductase [Pseudochryseolinea flava]
MKILVTGSNGLLGQKLSVLLQQDKNVELIATARGKSHLDITNGQFISLDVSDKHAVDEIFSRVKPDVVIHGAAMTQVDQCETDREACWKTNVDATQYITDACIQHNTHLVHVSTDFIFDGSHGPLDEEEKPNPVNYYGESKLAAEQLIMRSHASWSILRTVLVYGITNDMSRSNIVLWVKNSLEQGKTIQVVNDQWRTPTLAEDLAMGCYLAAIKKAKGIYHISGKDFLTPYDIAIATADYFNLDKSLIQATDSSKFKQPARRPAKTGFIIDKAKKDLGYEPHSFQEGIGVLAEQIR